MGEGASFQKGSASTLDHDTLVLARYFDRQQACPILPTMQQEGCKTDCRMILDPARILPSGFSSIALVNDWLALEVSNPIVF